jgi:asparagine synthase (glutamine-hydrolysing)
MCGIAAVLNWGDLRTLDAMTRLQAHRGPDDAGLWHCQTRDGWVGLGSRRLSILDLTPAGHMPMSNPEHSIWITYNGEIFNYPEHRRILESKGYRFRSGSDTEVILYLYEQYGIECLNRLNGMFAFAIWDSRLQHLFVARDHFGIKPLYYTAQKGRVGFASEAKSLLFLPGFEARIDLQALHQYLTFLWVPDPLTMFKGIFKLPAGHYALFSNGDLKIERYWDLKFPEASHKFDQDERRIAQEIRTRFTEVVRSQLLSDVPLGAFLSAGIDSSSIVAAMSQVSARPSRTFTISFPEQYRRGELVDNPDVAARTAKHFDCIHTHIVVEPDVVALLPRLTWHLDEPVADPAVITTYLVSSEASSSVKVLLSGVGGDELFAGYRKHQGHYLSGAYKKIPSFVRSTILERSILALPVFRGMALRNPVRLAKKMVRSGSLPAEDRFLMDSTYLSDSEKLALYTRDIHEVVKNFDPWVHHRSYFSAVRDADFLNQMLYVDTKAFMASLNLTYNDKMSMACSVEVRVPFLDWKFAEWVASNVDPQLKLHRGQTKYILKKAMQPLLPSEVLKQKKTGFGAPTDHWLANDLRDMVNDLLSEPRIRRRGLFDTASVDRLISAHRSGREERASQIWQLLTLEVWMQTFIDRSSTTIRAPRNDSYASTDSRP